MHSNLYNLFQDSWKLSKGSFKPSRTSRTSSSTFPISLAQGQLAGEYLAFSAFLFSPPIRTPGTIQVNGYREREKQNT